MGVEAHRVHDEAAEQQELARLSSALKQAPRGALALSGLAVVLMMIAWFAIYLLVFVPRGSIG
jgi:hypothetical protein